MRYNSAASYYQKRFGEKVYRLSLPGGTTCPNRDGKIDTRGCIFCSAGGSGEFTPDRNLSINDQIEAAKGLVGQKCGQKFIAYFQSFTSTYGDIDDLRHRFLGAASHPEIVALSVATRPDCLPDVVMALLREVNAIKPLYVELGLQTIHESTATYIRRGYPTAVFDEAVRKLHAAGIPVIAHVILGLPNETAGMMLDTVRHVANLHLHGIKLQLLHVLRGTDLEKEYTAGKFSVFEMDEYIELLGRCIEILPPDMVVYRLTGDGDKKLLIAPEWSANKRNVLNRINHFFKQQDMLQGRLYEKRKSD